MFSEFLAVSHVHNDMTICKKSYMVPATMAKQGVLVLALASIAGCSSVGSLFGGDKVDYKSAGKAAPLDVPPDLTQLQRENRYAIPETNRGSATASGYSLQQQGLKSGVIADPQLAGGKQIMPQGVGEVRVERAGNVRWLVVKQKPEVLFPLVKEFWQDSGFVVIKEVPEAGIMETDWAENRAKIPQDVIRNTIGKVLDSLYSSGERDKFRTRLERTADGGTEIYISHRGVEEVLVGQYKETTSWAPRPSDPSLEDEFLSRLMVRLGIAADQAKGALASAKPAAEHAKLVKAPNASFVEVDEGFDRAWRRIGLALDRVGFTVEDRDRIQGVYFVRYVDQLSDAQAKAAGEKGFFSRLFSFGSSDKSKDAQRFQIAVKAAEGTGTATQVFVMDDKGKPENSEVGSKILTLLNEQLK